MCDGRGLADAAFRRRGQRENFLVSAPPRWRWVFTLPAPSEALSVAQMLRAWNSARRLGLELQSLERDGVPVDARTLRLLNDWIACGGAFNASRQDYFEAWARLERVLGSTYRRRSRSGGRESL